MILDGATMNCCLLLLFLLLCYSFTAIYYQYDCCHRDDDDENDAKVCSPTQLNRARPLEPAVQPVQHPKRQ